VIDPTVGFLTEVKLGDRITQNDALGIVYSSDAGRAREAAVRIQSAYTIDDLAPAGLQTLVKEIINE
jgi:thymidine phosphorylase